MLQSLSELEVKTAKSNKPVDESWQSALRSALSNCNTLHEAQINMQINPESRAIVTDDYESAIITGTVYGVACSVGM